MSCCWICTACKENEYVQDEFTCKACELGWWPNKELEGKQWDITMYMFNIRCLKCNTLLLMESLVPPRFWSLCFFLFVLQFVLLRIHKPALFYFKYFPVTPENHSSPSPFRPLPASLYLWPTLKGFVCSSKALLLFHLKSKIEQFCDSHLVVRL